LAAIITGGASGLGLATAERLSALGARVTLFDRDKAAGEAAAARINGRYTYLDVCDDESVARGISQAEAAYGTARILVNCAGIAPAANLINPDFVPHNLEPFRKTLEVNIVGTFNVLSKFAARLARIEPVGEERGIIVNTSSGSAYDGLPGHAAYAASKAGVIGMMLPIARELAQYGIRVVTIAPGLFWTAMFAATLPEGVPEALGTQVPFPNRLGRPEEFAMLVESIIANPMLNAATIRLDGAVSLAALDMKDALTDAAGSPLREGPAQSHR